ncbi:hypothetical protein LNKW23_07450 [Paralimibaculum aggregatum]|uniref:Uncharacterized protein n=1 Tax=Paralimibaculum aggregatum TaxID=3036245 RepID=A0ABQ6LIP3_9RHOB|nr:hypothetical protein [Limibaculum sp. NKW23]GMG81532.1 hypothetical protein LNKW23_07450 [Limibaculum sp. NKW23]
MSAQSKFDAATEALIAAREALQREIAGYPTPVSGCDLQYTHLIGQLSRVRRAIEALDREVFVATPRQLAPEGRAARR